MIDFPMFFREKGQFIEIEEGLSKKFTFSCYFWWRKILSVISTKPAKSSIFKIVQRAYALHLSWTLDFLQSFFFFSCVSFIYLAFWQTYFLGFIDFSYLSYHFLSRSEYSFLI